MLVGSRTRFHVMVSAANPAGRQQPRRRAQNVRVEVVARKLPVPFGGRPNDIAPCRKGLLSLGSGWFAAPGVDVVVRKLPVLSISGWSSEDVHSLDYGWFAAPGVDVVARKLPVPSGRRPNDIGPGPPSGG